jgi:glycosyltransferase involved in cell wall biosynthesis
MALTQHQSSDKCCHIGVDLTLMIPGGANGGIKPAILTFLKTLEERFGNSVKFTFLTNSSTRSSVEFLVRKEDQMICILLAHGSPWPSAPAVSCPEFTPGELRKIGIDVLYCPFGPTNHSTPDIPTLSMVTDLLHRDYPFSISEAERTWREEYFREIIADADYIQCISQYTLDRFLKHYRVAKDRLFFTYLPVERRLEDRTVVTPRRPYFIYPANFWIHKNHEILLIAYRIYRRSTKDPWDLVFTGNPDDRTATIQELAELLGLKKHVHFAGHLDEFTFAKTLGEATALIYPSLHEGFGIPLLEAMRFRKPIICSKYTSIPEIAGEAAICVDGKKPIELAAAMGQLTTDPTLREDLICKGEERLKAFRIETEIDKLYEVFEIAKRSNTALIRFRRHLRRYVKARRLRWQNSQLRRPASVFAGALARYRRRIRHWLSSRI